MKVKMMSRTHATDFVAMIAKMRMNVTSNVEYAYGTRPPITVVTCMPSTIGNISPRTEKRRPRNSAIVPSTSWIRSITSNFANNLSTKKTV